MKAALVVLLLTGMACAQKSRVFFYCGTDGQAHCDHGEHAMDGKGGIAVNTVACSHDDAYKALEKSCGVPKPMTHDECLSRFKSLVANPEELCEPFVGSPTWPGRTTSAYENVGDGTDSGSVQSLRDSPCIPQDVADYMSTYHPDDEIKPVCPEPESMNIDRKVWVGTIKDEKPEPIDVPAIILKCTPGSPWGTECCDGKWPYCHEEGITTCADKRRILLTAEDRSKHCVTFQDPNVFAFAQASKETMTKITCKPGSVDVDNAGTIGRTTISSGHSDCPLHLEVIMTNVIINGKHYDWCGPTHDGYTPCYRKAVPSAKKVKP
jgi:hypothetical protein